MTYQDLDERRILGSAKNTALQRSDPARGDYGNQGGPGHKFGGSVMDRIPWWANAIPFLGGLARANVGLNNAAYTGRMAKGLGIANPVKLPNTIAAALGFGHYGNPDVARAYGRLDPTTTRAPQVNVGDRSPVDARHAAYAALRDAEGIRPAGGERNTQAASGYGPLSQGGQEAAMRNRSEAAYNNAVESAQARDAAAYMTPGEGSAAQWSSNAQDAERAALYRAAYARANKLLPIRRDAYDPDVPGVGNQSPGELARLRAAASEAAAAPNAVLGEPRLPRGQVDALRAAGDNTVYKAKTAKMVADLNKPTPIRKAQRRTASYSGPSVATVPSRSLPSFNRGGTWS